MPKFIVVLSRECIETQEAEAVVEADSEESAKAIALDKADRDRLHWRNVDFDSGTEAVSVSPRLDDMELSELEDGDVDDEEPPH